MAVDGRLLTVNGFSLQAAPEARVPALEASFSVTTYLTPPGEGLAGGASPESPARTKDTDLDHHRERCDEKAERSRS